MKTKYIFLFSALALVFSSCKKCETCTPYQVVNVVNDSLSASPDRYAQTLTLCDKTDIDAYESLTTFIDGDAKHARFICK
jgi:hypothetical protein